MNALGGRDGLPPFLTLDLSRLLSRAGAAVPTGIDRVELAYAEYLLAHAPERTEFVALHPLGRFGTLPRAATARFVDALAARWDKGVADDGTAARLGRRLLHGLMLPRADRGMIQPEPRGTIYLLLSHHHLTRPAVVADTIARRRAAFVPMVHDLIPLQFPEYCREQEAAKHAVRIDTVCRLADAVLVPSEAVRQSLLPTSCAPDARTCRSGRCRTACTCAHCRNRFPTRAIPPRRPTLISSASAPSRDARTTSSCSPSGAGWWRNRVLARLTSC